MSEVQLWPSSTMQSITNSENPIDTPAEQTITEKVITNDSIQIPQPTTNEVQKVVSTETTTSVTTPVAGDDNVKPGTLEITGKRKLDEPAKEEEEGDNPSPKIARVEVEIVNDINSKVLLKNKQEYTRWSVEPHCSVVRNSMRRIDTLVK